jgi:hypothetical protein
MPLGFILRRPSGLPLRSSAWSSQRCFVALKPVASTTLVRQRRLFPFAGNGAHPTGDSTTLPSLVFRRSQCNTVFAHSLFLAVKLSEMFAV